MLDDHLIAFAGSGELTLDDLALVLRTGLQIDPHGGHGPDKIANKVYNGTTIHFSLDFGADPDEIGAFEMDWTKSLDSELEEYLKDGSFGKGLRAIRNDLAAYVAKLDAAFAERPLTEAEEAEEE